MFNLCFSFHTTYLLQPDLVMNRTAAYSSAVYSAYEAADFSKGDPRSYELDRDLLGKLVVNPSSIPDLPRPWIALTSYDSMHVATYQFTRSTTDLD